MLRAIVAVLFLGTHLIVICVPLLLLSLVHPSRRVFSWVARTWSRALLGISGAEIVVEGRTNIPTDQPLVVFANHQSAIDIPILFWLFRGNVRFLAKKSLFRVPIFGWVLTRFGHIPIDRTSARAAATQLGRTLGDFRRRSMTLAVFPEGTRSRDGALLPFRKGAMKIGARAGLPLVPVAIDGSRNVCPARRFRLTPGVVRVVVGRALSVDEVESLTPEATHERVREAIGRCLSGECNGLPVEVPPESPRGT